jgi:hypothetical protein
LIRATDAAFLRLKANGKVRDLLQYPLTLTLTLILALTLILTLTLTLIALNLTLIALTLTLTLTLTPNSNPNPNPNPNGKVRDLLQYREGDGKTGPLMDVLTYYLSDDGVEELYPYPERANVASNTVLARVLDTGVVYICGFRSFNSVDLFIFQFHSAIWKTVSEHYGVELTVDWVYSDPSEGSSVPFDNLRRGRDDGGCDVDAASAAIGGYFEGLPRATGPLGQFAVSMPTQAAQFSVVVSDGSHYTTFDDVLSDVTKLTVCFANVNDGITSTYFRTSTRVPVFSDVVETCESMVLSDASGTTVFFSEFESTNTADKKEGLTSINSNILSAIGHYATFDPMPSCAEVSTSALIRATDAAFLRVKVDGKLRDLYQYYVSPIFDVVTYYLSEDGIEEKYPYPERAKLASNTVLARVLDTGVVYVCGFTPDWLAYPEAGIPVVDTYALQLQRNIWNIVGEHYGVELTVEFVYSDPVAGSSAHFDNLRRGRDDGGCDVDAASAAIGGYFEGLPRATGPLGQFAIALPTMSSLFSVVVSDGSHYTTFDDILSDVTKLTVCFANVNDGVTATYFRTSTRVPVFSDYVETCESMVLSDASGMTVFFSEFETTDTADKKEGLKTISSGVVSALAHFATFDPMPPAAELCTSIAGVFELDKWCKDNCMLPGMIELHSVCDPVVSQPDEMICTCGASGSDPLGHENAAEEDASNDSNQSLDGGAVAGVVAAATVACVAIIGALYRTGQSNTTSGHAKLLEPAIEGSTEYATNCHCSSSVQPVVTVAAV